MENNNCCEVLLQVLRENVALNNTYQRKFNNKVVLSCLMASVFAVAVTIQLKDQHEQIEKLKYEIDDLRAKEGE